MGGGGDCGALQPLSVDLLTINRLGGGEGIVSRCLHNHCELTRLQQRVLNPRLHSQVNLMGTQNKTRIQESGEKLCKDKGDVGRGRRELRGGGQ